MPNSINKLIVTNGSALKAKYGTRTAAVRAAIRSSIAADKQRGLVAKLVEIDDAATMKRLGGAAVKNALDPRQCKQAVDAAFRAHNPEYLLLLGAIDVIPHQDLLNPAYSPNDDDDQYALGDIPYACEAAYSVKPENFKAPTRVVGRLPDLNGARDPRYLLQVLSTAARAKSRPASAYADYLGVSAKPWAASTTLSLHKLFGPKASALLSPPSGPRWSAKRLAARCHFFNCHGSPADTHFYGQQGSRFPIAHDAAWVRGKLSEGTVLSAECCYGAELFDPAKAAGQPGICNAYLGAGAYAVFGSSTIAYGPASGNGSADLLCQFFMKHVLEGASLGRAALEARQDFVRSAATLDPFDLKTLAQFSLMADPSIQPVETARGYDAPPASKSRSAHGVNAENSARELRRARLVRDGVAIGKATPHVDSESSKSPPREMRALLEREARSVALENPRFASFQVVNQASPSASAQRSGAKSARLVEQRHIHMTIGHVSGKRDAIKRLVAIVATQWDGQTLVRTLHSR